MAAQKFFILGCGFLVGIIIAAFYSLSFVTFYLIALSTFIVGAILFNRYLFLISLFIIGLFLGVFYSGYRTNLLSSEYPKSSTGNFSVVSISETLTTDKSQRFLAKFEGNYKGDVLVFYSSEDKVLYGEKFLVSGEFKLAERPGDSPVIFTVKISRSGERVKTVGRYLYDLKSSLVNVLIRELSPKAGALAAGLLLGDKANFSSEFKDAMQRSGTTHTVALSGYNISVLVGALAILVAGFSRRTRIWLYFLAITFFTLMVGAEPSIVRAAIMGGIFLLSKELGRDMPASYSLVFAGFLMLLWNPIYIYSVGFQLSFLSFAGIVYLVPAIARVVKLKLNLFTNLVLETLSAQLAVLPLIVSYFGGFSPMSLLANVFILWTVPIGMFFVFCMLVLNFAFPPILFFISWICEMILGYQIFIINLFSKLYVPAGEYFKNGSFVALYAFAILGFIIIAGRKNKDERV